MTADLETSERTPRSPLDYYRGVLGARLAEARITELSESGELSGHHSALGHEAIGFGIGSAVEFDDVVQPSYRSGASIMHARGLTVRELVLQGFGLIPGIRDQHPGRARILRSSGIVGGQVPSAVGVAMSFKLRQQPNVVVSVFGDGTASSGAIHEAMNVSGVKSLPIVFVIENNGIALSNPFSSTTRVASLADRGAGYGISASQADGYDVAAVQQATSVAVERARSEQRPGLLELTMLRPGPHAVGFEDPRTPEQIAEANRRDCVAEARERAIAAGELDPAMNDAMLADMTALVDEAVDEARAARAAQVVEDGAPRYSAAEAWGLAHATPPPAWMGA
ncbi:MAG: thiamine pyrophosphate-dependent dehydrogenase E1 component subunit alpha [Acidimicrobiales bacterium]